MVPSIPFYNEQLKICAMHKRPCFYEKEEKKQLKIWTMQSEQMIKYALPVVTIWTASRKRLSQIKYIRIPYISSKKSTIIH